jgi:hypothetical protein
MTDFADHLRTAIDPVVVPVGFASGQGSTDQTIFCVDGDTFAAAYPGLPWDELGGGPGTCTDLVVDGNLAAGLHEARLDGIALVDLLRGCGLDGDADSLAEALGAPVQQVAPVVAAAFARLLVATARER